MPVVELWFAVAVALPVPKSPPVDWGWEEGAELMMEKSKVSNTAQRYGAARKVSRATALCAGTGGQHNRDGVGPYANMRVANATLLLTLGQRMGNVQGIGCAGVDCQTSWATG